MNARATRRRAARGLSMVELLAGMALALPVIALLGTALAQQVQESRRLHRELRLEQDLRSASDVLGRSLRRAAHWGDAATGAPAANPYAAVGPAAAASDAVAFAYSRDASENGVIDTNERYGLRLRQGVLELQFGGSWQALTDSGTVRVTAFEVQPTVHSEDLGALCPQSCAAGSTSCPPRQHRRSLRLRIDASARDDATVRRSLTTQVRLRNDTVTGACDS